VYDFACGSRINNKKVQRPCPCSARFVSVARSWGIYLLLPAIPGSASASMANRRAADKRERWFVYEVCVWSSGNSSNKS
jgi:hypothetical protein